MPNKYDPLAEWLRTAEGDHLTLGFETLEGILGSALPASSYQYQAHWQGTTPGRPGGAIASAGWRVEHLDQSRRTITLRRVAGGRAEQPTERDANPSDPAVLVQQDVPDDDAWLWEGNVQRVLRDWLVSEGWTVTAEADPVIRQRGVDLMLERGGRLLAVEVKGYPQAKMLRGRDKGQTRKYHPASQAGQYFAGAVQWALRKRDELPDSEIALAFPDVPRYRTLMESSVRSLQDLGVGVFLVRGDGSVRQEISPRRR